jgi:hypothetical protein
VTRPVLCDEHLERVAYQGMIYVATACQEPTLCGGLPGDAIWRYNPSNDTWAFAEPGAGRL